MADLLVFAGWAARTLRYLAVEASVVSFQRPEAWNQVMTGLRTASVRFRPLASPDRLVAANRPRRGIRQLGPRLGDEGRELASPRPGSFRGRRCHRFPGRRVSPGLRPTSRRGTPGSGAQ